MQKVNFMTLALAFQASLILVALVMGWLLGVSAFAAFRMDAESALLGIAATFPPLLGIHLAERFEFEGVARMIRWLEHNLMPHLSGASLWQLAMLSILAGVGEELLFRGVVQAALGDAFTPWVGLLAASALFGIAHYVSYTYAISAGLFGLYLGWLMITWGNLFAPVVTHSLYDFLALIYLMRRSR